MIEELNPKNISDDDILDIEGAMKLLKMRRSSIYQLTHGRKLRYFKLDGKRIYFLRSDLVNFIFNSKNMVLSNDEIEKQAQKKLLESENA